ncbi:hypothetical protein M758_4G241100 [Ceratodon purpureus]|nr:hypothetical protein M758_4G241100 [Ceratodon purpureus]
MLGFRNHQPCISFTMSKRPQGDRAMRLELSGLSWQIKRYPDVQADSLAVACSWSNGTVYAVGRTLRRVIAKEALTYDYKWTGVSDGPAAELCFCRTGACRGFIAEPTSKFMERTIHHYEKELVRLKNIHDDDEQSLQDQLTTMDSDGKRIIPINQHLSLIRRLDKNDKLQVAVDNMEAALHKAKDARACARHAKWAERQTKYMRKLQSLDCNPLNQKPIPKIPSPPPSFSTSTGSSKFSFCGWFANEDEPIQPLPLSLALACSGALKYVPMYKKPWVPSGSRSRGTLNLKHFPPPSVPTSRNPTPRTVRPRNPPIRPLGKLPEDVAHWPEAGFMSLDERRKVMAWIEGRISARDSSRSVYPPENAERFAYWLHMRVRKPGEKKMRTFRAHWSGISSQDLIDRYEEESVGVMGCGSMSRRAVHCILGDVLTYTSYGFKWNKSELKLVEDRDGDQWPLLWSDLLSLPGPVPEYSTDRALCASHMQRCTR